MQSLKYLYRIGKGPSSSHTMGPLAAAKRFLDENPDADSYKVILYGSLAKTGKGHMTDIAVSEIFAKKNCEIIFDCETPTDYHPNTMDIIAFSGGKESARKRFYSIGGGEVVAHGEKEDRHAEVYPLSSFTEISRALHRSSNLEISGMELPRSQLLTA